eukprot:jgi/Pico_ML_1/54303/g4671.t1
MSARKDTAIELKGCIDQAVRVKLAGGREVEGVLKGYDQMLNLVLDDAVEYLRDPDDPMTLTDKKRRVGLTVCRGTAVTFVCPRDGMREIANPFVPAEGTT